VGHAGDQLADGGHLVVLDQLGLEDPLLGHVLHQDDDRAGAGGGGPAGLVGKRRGGETEDALGPLQPHHQRGAPLPVIGGADQLLHGLGGAEQRLAEASPDELALAELGERGQRPVGAEHGAGGAHHGDALGERVEGGLPLLLAPPHDLVEPAVGQHHRRVGGDGGE
jgi:hypothetical protein